MSQYTERKIINRAYGIGMNINSIIGSGIVTAPGIIWNSVKSPGIVLLLWFIGGLVSMAGSLSYVELGVKHKISGGETKYLQTAYPKPKYFISYLFSFMYIFAIRPGITSAVLQSAAQYFWYTISGHQFDIVPNRNGWHLPFSPFWAIKFIAIAMLFLITAYHMINNRLANFINQSLAVIKLITYSIIAIAGICRLFLDWETSRVHWQKPIDGNTDFTAYTSSILLIMFSYEGWNNLNYSLNEFKNVEKELLFSNSISVVIVTLLYLFVNIAFISVVPKEDILNNGKADQIIAATFFNKLFGGNEIIVRIFTFLIVLSVIGTAATNVWSGSRVIIATARSGFFLKYSRQLSYWHKNYDTPVNALLAQFIWCSLIILFVGSSFTITNFELFSSFSMYSYWIFYFATGVGLLIIRKYKLLERENELLYKVPLPIAGIFILAGLYILIFSFIVNVQCPISLPPNSDECINYLRAQQVHKMSPFFISYGFLFIALMFWYHYWWKTSKEEINRTNETKRWEVMGEFENSNDEEAAKGEEIRGSIEIKGEIETINDEESMIGEAKMPKGKQKEKDKKFINNKNPGTTFEYYAEPSGNNITDQ
ncbi:16421_t:CDS:2 [Funneliformis geosporum]|uniref:16421_t:CDS:1 n=1 Tax=Funneliformis geosporum TaxID=1117311 RepID=A0A9W4X0E8_9GLOM|nr:16421_t:CDS:2 [Funneliformis geosporum]